MAMEAALVSVATGVLKPVIGKLTALLGNEYKRFKTVRKEIKSLTHELAAMEAFLLKMSEDEDPDVQDKVWMNEVWELSYDMEDAIDDFMQSIGDKDKKPDGFIEKIKNTLGSLGKMKARRRIGKEIQDLKKQIKEVGDRNTRYKGRQTFTSTKNETFDPRALAIFENASDLVGIDEQKDSILKLLTQEDGVSSTQHQVKMVSIVGSGGMGKTTLAGQVYQELKGQFKCHAFVSISRNPDMMTIMRTILSEVSNQRYADTEVGSMQQLISKIKDFLADKRYFIVVDDIWNEKSWAVIKQALPTTSFGSKIITTTRMKNVALSCHSSFAGHIYNINPLSMAHSRQLFYRRLFNSEENCPSYLKEVSEQILIKCDGLPLAIIAISGLLSKKKRTKHIWNQVKDSIGRALERNPSVEGMMKILSLSYFDLPPHLKTCLLYLSLFPEDYVIGKNDLIRNWIAEGFICTEGGCTVHELGERCFNELINRSLIQPVKMMEPMPRRRRLVRRWIAEGYSHGEGECTKQFDGTDWSSMQALGRYKYDKVIGCRVHDTILDFIVSKSVEENFVTLGCVPNLPVAAQSKVRRLSIQANKQGNAILPTGLVLSHTRSLYLFDYTEEIPCLDELRHLHVLNFGRCFKLENHHLANIGRLFLLRYMNLKGTRISELPEQIGHAQCLEMLDLRKTYVRELPATIANLGKLVHLLTDVGVKFPDGIGRMQALEILKKVSVLKQTLTFMQELGKLQNLRKLALSFHCDAAAGDINGVNEDCKEALVSSLLILGTKNLCSLAIWHGGSFLEQGPLCPMPLSLQKLVTYMSVLPQVPQWVGSLVNIHQLCLQVEAFAEDDLHILGGLQALLILDLVVMSKTTDRRLIISGEVGFPCLSQFCIHHADEGGIDVMFARGAMPRLERLEIRFDAFRSGSIVTGGAFYLGINNLPCLIAVICQVYGKSQAAETAMKRAVSMHPNRPVLHFEPFHFRY